MIIDELCTISDRLLALPASERKPQMKHVKKWYKELIAQATMRDKVFGVNWGAVPLTKVRDFANEIDLPFVDLVRCLQANKLNYNIHSLIRTWERLKGLNQQHIITYCRMRDLLACTETIMGDKIIELSYKGADGIKAFMDYYNNDKNVECTLRELLGISATTDIKQAFIKWAQKNHPDKGGSHNAYVAMSSCYEEWRRIQNEK